MSKQNRTADVAKFLEKLKAWGATLSSGEQAILQQLIQPLSSPSSELSEEALTAVSGGQGPAQNQLSDTTLNQQKTSQKSADKMDSYIRS